MTARERLWSAAIAALAVLYLFTQVLPLWGAHPEHGFPKSHQNDFKHIYLGAMLLRDGASPYPPENLMELAGLFSREDPRFRTILPFVYPPFTGLVLRPFAGLSFDAAAHAWMAANHLMAVGGVALLVWVLGWRPGPSLFVFLLFGLVLSHPLFRQNNAGQLNAVLLAGYCAVFALSRSPRWGPAAGAVAAAAALFKLSPALLGTWFAATRDWRGLAAMAGAGLALAGASIAVAGWAPHAEFLRMIPEMGYGRSTWEEFGQRFWRDPFNQSANALLHQLLVPDLAAESAARGAALANALTRVFVLAVGGLLAAVLWSAWRAAPGPDGQAVRDAAFAVVVLASLLIPSLCWDHYMVQGLVPAAILWRLGGRGRWIALAAVVLWAVPLNAETGRVAFWLLPDAGFGIGTSPWASSLKLYPTVALLGWGAIVALRGRSEPKRDAPGGGA